MAIQIRQINNELTPREIECLKCAAHDMSVAETAAYLSRSPAMIKKNRVNALRKLHCQSIAGAIYLLFKQQLF
jgi:DNA-binding CsgD family transcriptional regulator